MLGEMLGETQGKITGQRVLPVECCPKIEISFQDAGKILGEEITEIGTYWSAVKEDGTLYGEGQGCYMTKDNEIVTWTGQGVGKFTGKGATSWRGSLYFQTSVKKLAMLNNIGGVFEYEVDEKGNTSAKIWGWK